MVPILTPVAKWYGATHATALKLSRLEGLRVQGLDTSSFGVESRLGVGGGGGVGGEGRWLYSGLRFQ